MRSIAAGDGAALAAAGRLLDRFNREYDEPTPGAEWLAERLPALIGAGDTTVLLGGEGPDGIAVVRFQPSIWSDGDEGYVAELYVVPERRRAGLGAALMAAVLDRCRERRCDYVFLGTDAGDADAHRLYERFGFRNANDGERMYVYEREL